jgi:hypothetical protein
MLTCAGSELAKKVTIEAGDFSMFPSSAKMLPLIAETKKVWIIMKQPSFQNSDASKRADEMCPSHVAKNLEIVWLAALGYFIGTDERMLQLTSVSPAR